VYEARAMGADALLLIVGILSPPQLAELLALSRELRMQSLVEVHNRAELQIALGAGAEIIGINNRDLHTFKTDLAVTEGLTPLVPKGKTIVSESGISSDEHVKRLAEMKVNAVLVGEALVTAPDVAEKVRELSGQALPPKNP
jgi:indole-3-glycerol phosphate synthase